MDNLAFQIKLQFLFGLENGVVEDLLDSRYPPSPGADPEAIEFARERLVIEYIAELLSRYSIEDARLLVNGDFPTSFIAGAVPPTGGPIDYTCWNVIEADWLSEQDETDLSEHLTNSSGGRLDGRFGQAPFYRTGAGRKAGVTVGVQLVSPLFQLSQISHVLPLIARTLRKLTDGTAGRQSADAPVQHHVWVSETCDFSIKWQTQISRQIFPLRTLQNLFVFWALYEKQIERIQPRHHRSPYALEKWSLWSNLAPDVTRVGIQRAFYTTQDIPDLLKLLEFTGDEDQFAKIDLKTYLERMPFPIPARLHVSEIQFREHAGTLDITKVAFWLIFTATVLKFCHSAAARGGTINLSNHEELQPLTEFMREIGFTEEAVRYYLQRARSTD
ncbi:hypothetical protein MMC24_002674 [Lignoscripta atroalba]|nr:hypothetical protein [Lignoscripta atroalba]